MLADVTGISAVGYEIKKLSNWFWEVINYWSNGIGEKALKHFTVWAWLLFWLWTLFWTWSLTNWKTAGWLGISGDIAAFLR